MTHTVEPIREFEGGDAPIFYACKGHVEADVFVAEALELWDATLDPTRVRHTHFRNVPAGADYPGRWLYIEARGAGRGAYPATVVDV